jgi:phosphopantetheinyl transferase
MPIFYQQDIDQSTKLAVWKIEESEDFFLSSVPVQRNITHPHKRLQHLAGRFLLKYLFPDFPVALIKIADTRKPFLENEAYHFSISHCGDFAAVIVSRNRRVGVDIEVPDLKVVRIKNKFLHQQELKELEILQDHLKSADNNKLKNEFNSAELRALTLLWSSKEAIYKWWSFGNVDFRENIRLNTGVVEKENVIGAEFINETVTALSIHFKVFEKICLAWVYTE